jgi:DNA-binding MarR family transcriptional regulator
MSVVLELSAVATAALRAGRDAILHEPRRALTVSDLTDAVGVERQVLDAALGELDDAGLIRLRGDVSTRRSCVELTGAGARAGRRRLNRGRRA